MNRSLLQFGQSSQPSPLPVRRTIAPATVSRHTPATVTIASWRNRRSRSETSVEPCRRGGVALHTRQQDTTSVARVLSSFDDFPIHQTSHPIAQTASTDINHYDRYFFNGYTKDTRLFFALAMGLYPNRHVADASFSVVVDGGTVDARQISVHASRRAPADRADANEVGPIRVEVLEPLNALRLVVEAPEHGLRADLTFVRRSAPIEESPLPPADRSPRRVRLHPADPVRWVGGLDRGRRRTHRSRTGRNPRLPGSIVGGQAGRRTRFDRRSGRRSAVLLAVGPDQLRHVLDPLRRQRVLRRPALARERIHRPDRRPGPSPDAAPGAEAMRSVDYTIDWRPGTRTAESFELVMTPWEGEPSTIRLEPLFEFHMSGLGYLSPEWSHGVWKGELAVGGERWDSAGRRRAGTTPRARPVDRASDDLGGARRSPGHRHPRATGDRTPHADGSRRDLRRLLG